MCYSTHFFLHVCVHNSMKRRDGLYHVVLEANCETVMMPCISYILRSDPKACQKMMLSNPCSSLASKKIRLGFLDIECSFLFMLLTKSYFKVLSSGNDLSTTHLSYYIIPCTDLVSSQCFQTLM